MNKKRLGLILFMGLLLLVSACGKQDKESTEKSFQLAPPIQVELTIDPISANVGEVITFVATVKQGEELVDDANDVQFEIWKEGQREEELFIDGNHIGSGQYTAEKIIEEPGTYFVMYHVTAREMHRMEKTEFIIEGD